MEFRPCIDIHNGKVKQIVGGSINDENNAATENFVSKKDAAFFANFYRDAEVYGGHVIILNREGSDFYEESKAQALNALSAFPGGLQVGGGINPDNAKDFLDAGASHVIVTGYVFSNGEINYANLTNLRNVVGRDRIVLDLSCRKRDDEYYVVTDRWQKFTNEMVSIELLEQLSDYCDEFLIHAADVEGKQSGIEQDLVERLSVWKGKPLTYAGGVKEYDDILLIKELSDARMNVTVGSALDLFGGPLNFETIMNITRDV